MSRSRSTSAQLGRLLNAAETPLYVLDADGQIVFINRALRDWLGGERADRLLGQTCRYHSIAAEAADADPVEALAAALCPPPSSADGGAVRTTLNVPMPDGTSLRRTADVLPIAAGPSDAGPITGDSTEPIGTIVLLGPETPRIEPAPRTSPATVFGEPGERDSRDSIPESERLHALLSDFRRRAAVRYGADRLVGYSPAMQCARQQVELAAQSRASVLLVGPEGSGRHHTAAAIHYRSLLAGRDRGDPRRAGPLVPIACDVLGAELIHSTVAAIASGSVAAGPPSRDAADAGTLLLQHVDQMPSDVQRDVAEILARASFPLRLMATAGEPLDELARQGRFHGGLAAVLGTLVIRLPRLAERRDDIPLLAQMFLEEHNAQGERQLDGFTPEAMDRLVTHAWPGNLDELAEIVAESHRHAGGRRISVDDLPSRLSAHQAAEARPPREPETIDLGEFLQRIEGELIQRALAEARGNKAQAARLLGLTRPRLYRRLKELGIDNAQLDDRAE